ncbi:universal stress protein [Geodermatophilus sp. DSM 44513]|uniref:universal stress protein n=1 Tax=Geodermatophilus sp. DSM 44513 TaxID=1528104 RepID=UPI0014134931|nr:universal stress protein [Geodermatophilus sp. DSM 44513]WNV75261.1 universal stress protein [Geodermatophilus sp. DSM 44513]
MSSDPMTAEPAPDAADLPGDRPAARIVVGVDGSPGARAALVWALAAAARSDAFLEVVSTFPVTDLYWVDPYLLDPGRIESIQSDTDARVRALLNEVMSEPAVATVKGAEAIQVHVVVLPGPPTEHLVQRAAGAQLLVVGSRGRGGVRSTLLGSVALHCSTHAPCPVVVVHPTPQPAAGRVVVGVDDSDMSRAALARAVQEAGRLGAEVEAVVVYQPVSYWSELYAVTAVPVGETLEQAQRRGEAIVAEVLGEEAGVAVRVVAEDGAPGDVLVRRADGAALLVVGSRSHNRLVGMVLGSVALHCVVHAPCPVMVVRPESAQAAAFSSTSAAGV